MKKTIIYIGALVVGGWLVFAAFVVGIPGIEKSLVDRDSRAKYGIEVRNTLSGDGIVVSVKGVFLDTIRIEDPRMDGVMAHACLSGPIHVDALKRFGFVTAEFSDGRKEWTIQIH